uniref:Putative polyprotein n=1 Tax=Moniliophthora roreri TaxID=221103 RepID=A0A0W0GB85_MONRR
MQVKRAEKELEEHLWGPVDCEFLPRFFGEPRDDYTESLDREVDLYDNFLHLYMGNLKWEERDSGYVHFLSIAGMNIEPKSYPGLQRTSSLVKAINQIVPKPIVIVVMIDGKPCRALIDTSSLGDFMSTQVADQLGVRKQYLEKPLPLHMAVQGSRSKIHCGATVDFRYQKIKSVHYFDIVNLSGYDIILGTPWLFSHKVRIGLNPSTVEIGSDMKLPIQGENVSEIQSQNIVIEEETLEATWQELKEYAKPICKTAADTPLPPLRVINHTIPLIDEEKVYSWRPSRCPQAFRSQWDQKRKDYTASGHWEVKTARNTMPMMLIPKSPKQKDLLRIVVDLRERNANTKKVVSPLPNIEDITRRVAKYKFRSIIDGKDAYEQIRVIPEHVDRTAVSTRTYTYHDDNVENDRLETCGISMPLFTGLEAHAVRSATDAGSGRPETSKEFAKRMKSFVRVSGPRRAQEGGSATHQTETQQQNFGSSMPDQPKPSDSSSLETSHKQDEGKERLFIRIPGRSAFKGTETQ